MGLCYLGGRSPGPRAPSWFSELNSNSMYDYSTGTPPPNSTTGGTTPGAAMPARTEAPLQPPPTAPGRIRVLRAASRMPTGNNKGLSSPMASGRCGAHCHVEDAAPDSTREHNAHKGSPTRSSRMAVECSVLLITTGSQMQSYSVVRQPVLTYLEQLA